MFLSGRRKSTFRKAPAWRNRFCWKKLLRKSLRLEMLEDRSVPSVTIGASFNGMSYSDTSCGCEPPDTIAASGPNHIVEAINTAIRISDKAGNTISTQQM